MEGLAFGAFGEVSTEVQQLINATAQFAAKRTWREMGARTQKEALGIRLQKYKKMVGISTVRSYAIAMLSKLAEMRKPPAELWREGRDGRPWTLQEWLGGWRFPQ